LGLALSEKQTPQIVEKIEKPKEQMEGLEPGFVLRRQTLFPTELRARGNCSDSKPFFTFVSYQLNFTVLRIRLSSGAAPELLLFSCALLLR
jgi:hypothetical protein